MPGTFRFAAVRRFAPLFALPLLAALPMHGTQAGQEDRVARGLAMFIQLPADAASGATVPISIEAYGFATATTPAALGGAQVEVGWDSESLGADAPSITATTDSAGHAVLNIPVPNGPDVALTLRMELRANGKTRQYTATVRRTDAYSLSLQVADGEVAPGGSIQAFAKLTKAGTGAPEANTPITFSLNEGTSTRSRSVVTTDADGRAAFRVAVPAVDELDWSYQVLATAPGKAASAATVKLRSETPGLPALHASTAEGSIAPGATAKFRVVARDSSRLQLARHPIEYWVGSQNAKSPKSDEDWKARGIRATTDAQGVFELPYQAPTLVPPTGLRLEFATRSTVGGYPVESTTSAAVESLNESVEVTPQAGAIVPGSPQHVFLQVTDAHGEPLKQAVLRVEGDGLSANATTDAAGEADVVWDAPVQLGSTRSVGPCAGGVASRLTVSFPASNRAAYQTCVRVDREADGFLEISPRVVRAGGKQHIQIVGAKQSANGYSVFVRARETGATRIFWLADAKKGVDYTVPADDFGLYTVTAIAPGEGRSFSPSSVAFIVAPPVVPTLKLQYPSGRLAPLGEVVIEGDLLDEAGKPLQGTITPVVGDVNSGESLQGLSNLDFRNSICGGDRSRCAEFLRDGPASEARRRAVAVQLQPVIEKAPVLANPRERAKEELRSAFASTLRSLEGAVFESSKDPALMMDVRRRGPGRVWQFNPELLTLTVAAMEKPPTTPGGESIALTDLITMDSQVTFDNVARRVTRLKLFQALSALRQFRKEHDTDDPIFQNPNLILRKLTETGGLSEDALRDPWGGQLQFVKTAAAPQPFLTTAKGFALHSPGPDGIAGNGDDVADPFGRILRSGSPYAVATREDRIVDARFDMQIADASVDAWRTLLETETGTALGDGGDASGASGVGLSSGSGSGSGRGGGYSRSGATSVGLNGTQIWLAPVKTDARGHFQIRVKLGAAETTYRLSALASADGGRAVVEVLEFSTSLPLSIRAPLSPRWVLGDRGEVPVTLTNRTDSAISAQLVAQASGAMKLAAGTATQTLIVPAHGEIVTRIGLAASSVGTGNVQIAAVGAAQRDEISIPMNVVPAAEALTRTRSVYLSKEQALAVVPSPSESIAAPAMLVLSKGLRQTLREALLSEDIDRLRTPSALAEVIELSDRIARWSAANADAELESLARATRAAAEGRYSVYRNGPADAFVHSARALRFAAQKPADAGTKPASPARKADSAAATTPPGCPPALLDDAELLEVEPGLLAAELGARSREHAATQAKTQQACWDSFAVEATTRLSARATPAALARVVLAFTEREHRRGYLPQLAKELRVQVALDVQGNVQGRDQMSRAERTFIYAALLSTAHLVSGSAPAARLRGWLESERDVRGGFGSPAATRAAVTALLQVPTASGDVSRIRVSYEGGEPREVVIAENAREEIRLPAGVTQVALSCDGGAVLARLSLPLRRAWSAPPSGADSPIRADITLPNQIRDQRALLRVSLRSEMRRSATFEVRLKLPPGVGLAARVAGVVQADGQLSIRRPASEKGDILEIPLRFQIPGKYTFPEGRVYVVHEDTAAAIVPARSIEVLAQ